MVDNEACERKMCTLMQKDYDIAKLKDATHAIINKCTSPLLQAFILVRKLDLLLSKLGNKEKLVAQVYEYRTLPNLLQSVLDDMNNASDNTEEVVEGQESEQNVDVLRLGVESEVMKASTFLLDNEWIHKVKTLLNSDNKITCNDVTEELTRRADTLQKHSCSDSLTISKDKSKTSLGITTGQCDGAEEIWHKWPVS